MELIHFMAVSNELRLELNWNLLKAAAPISTFLFTTIAAVLYSEKNEKETFGKWVDSKKRKTSSTGICRMHRRLQRSDTVKLKQREHSKVQRKDRKVYNWNNQVQKTLF